MAREGIDKQRLAAGVLMLQGQPLNFVDRPHLRQIYNCQAEKIILRTGRQCEKSTTLAALVVLEALTNRHARILIVFPRETQLRTFRMTRLMPFIEESPIVAKALLGGRSSVSATFIKLANGAEIYLKSAFNTADAVRGISCSFLIVDEFQDLAEGSLSVLEQCSAHAPKSRILLSGTPKTADNDLEIEYLRSTQFEWTTKCGSCSHLNTPTAQVLALNGLECSQCKEPIDFAAGEWIAKNPGAKSAGFWINSLAATWSQHEKLISWKQEYSEVRFKNEVLGQAVTFGDLIVSQQQVEECCGPEPSIQNRQQLQGRNLRYETMCMGVDWGGGAHSRTAICIGAFDDTGTFHTLLLRVLPVAEDDSGLSTVIQIIQEFGIEFIAADGNGGGAILNREVLSKLISEGWKNTVLFGILYAANEQATLKRSSHEYAWSVGRTPAISDVFTRVRAKKIIFPAQCNELLAEIWRETAVFDHVNRSIKYECAAGARDDVLHAATYALALSSKLWRSVA